MMAATSTANLASLERPLVGMRAWIEGLE